MRRALAAALDLLTLAATADTTATLRGDRVEQTTDVPVHTFTCRGFAATANVKR